MDFPKVWEEELQKCMEPYPLREDEKRTVTELAKSLYFRDEGGQAGVSDRRGAFWKTDVGRRRRPAKINPK